MRLALAIVLVCAATPALAQSDLYSHDVYPGSAAGVEFNDDHWQESWLHDRALEQQRWDVEQPSTTLGSEQRQYERKSQALQVVPNPAVDPYNRAKVRILPLKKHAHRLGRPPHHKASAVALRQYNAPQ